MEGGSSIKLQIQNHVLLANFSAIHEKSRLFSRFHSKIPASKVITFNQVHYYPQISIFLQLCNDSHVEISGSVLFEVELIAEEWEAPEILEYLHNQIIITQKQNEIFRVFYQRIKSGIPFYNGLLKLVSRSLPSILNTLEFMLLPVDVMVQIFTSRCCCLPSPIETGIFIAQAIVSLGIRCLPLVQFLDPYLIPVESLEEIVNSLTNINCDYMFPLLKNLLIERTLEIYDEHDFNEINELNARLVKDNNDLQATFQELYIELKEKEKVIQENKILEEEVKNLTDEDTQLQEEIVVTRESKEKNQNTSRDLDDKTKTGISDLEDELQLQNEQIQQVQSQINEIQQKRDSDNFLVSECDRLFKETEDEKIAIHNLQKQIEFLNNVEQEKIQVREDAKASKERKENEFQILQNPPKEEEEEEEELYEHEEQEPPPPVVEIDDSLLNNEINANTLEEYQVLAAERKNKLIEMLNELKEIVDNIPKPQDPEQNHEEEEEEENHEENAPPQEQGEEVHQQQEQEEEIPQQQQENVEVHETKNQKKLRLLMEIEAHENYIVSLKKRQLELLDHFSDDE